jgi:hypothetical protein
MWRHSRWISTLALLGAAGALLALWVGHALVRQTTAAIDHEAALEQRLSVARPILPRRRPQAEKAFAKAVNFSGAIKQALRSPNVFVWQSIRANEDASVICLRFKFSHRGHPIKKRIAVYANGKTSNTREAWDRHCTSSVSEMERVKLAVR